MNKTLFILFLILFLCAPVYGTTYYVQPDLGNDGNAGTSWGAGNSWATFEYGMSLISCGDTMLIGNGINYGVDYEFEANWTSACGDGDWTVIACSSFVEATDAAQLSGRYGAKLFGGEKITTWLVYSGSVYRASWAPTDFPSDQLNEMGMKSCFTLGQLGDTVDSLMIPQSSIANVNQAGEMFYDSLNEYMYVWAVGGVDPDVDTMIATVAPLIYFRKAVDRIKFWGIDLRFGKKNVITWGNDGTTDSVTISNCNVSGAGARNTQNAAVIGSKRFDGDLTAFHTLISACSIGVCVQTQDAGPGTWNAYNQGIETYSHEFITVESCYFYGTHANAIYFKNEFGDLSQPYTACVAKFNTIVYPPNSEQEGSKTGIMIDEMPDRDSVYGNIIVNANYGVRISFGSGDQASYEDDSPYKIFIANNTFINVEEAYFRMGQVPSFDSCGSENKFMYNLCYGHQNSAYLEGYATISFRDQYGTICQLGWAFDSNAYYDTTNAFSGELYSTYDDTSFSDWQGLGFDVNSYWADFKIDTTSPYTYELPDTTSLTMNETYGGRTWTVWGAVQPDSSNIPTAVDTTTTSVTIQVAYEGFTGVDTVWIFFDTDGTIAGADSSFFDVTDLGSPDTLDVTGLLANTAYDFWSIISAGVADRDTSSMLEVTTETAVSGGKRVMVRK